EELAQSSALAVSYPDGIADWPTFAANYRPSLLFSSFIALMTSLKYGLLAGCASGAAAMLVLYMLIRPLTTLDSGRVGSHNRIVASRDALSWEYRKWNAVPKRLREGDMSEFNLDVRVFMPKISAIVIEYRVTGNVIKLPILCDCDEAGKEHLMQLLQAMLFSIAPESSGKDEPRPLGDCSSPPP
ncbi:MAG: hypothetical protein KDB14_27165, partial [Planctomycetales bacterium]|nr:hypothetical protein [Planctomycetales bacterium]